MYIYIYTIIKCNIYYIFMNFNLPPPPETDLMGVKPTLD